MSSSCGESELRPVLLDSEDRSLDELLYQLTAGDHCLHGPVDYEDGPAEGLGADDPERDLDELVAEYACDRPRYSMKDMLLAVLDVMRWDSNWRAALLAVLLNPVWRLLLAMLEAVWWREVSHVRLRPSPWRVLLYMLTRAVLTAAPPKRRVLVAAPGLR